MKKKPAKNKKVAKPKKTASKRVKKQLAKHGINAMKQQAAKENQLESHFKEKIETQKTKEPSERHIDYGNVKKFFVKSDLDAWLSKQPDKKSYKVKKYVGDGYVSSNVEMYFVGKKVKDIKEAIERSEKGMKLMKMMIVGVFSTELIKGASSVLNSLLSLKTKQDE